MIGKFKKACRNPILILLVVLDFRTFRVIPDEIFLKIKYKLTIKKKLNIKHPNSFNEKLQWLKIYDRNSKYSQMVDKYNVRDYVNKVVGEECLIPLLGVYDSFEEIDFDRLPNQFVLKCTHDSGGLVICRDKNELDKEFARKKINKCLKNNYFYKGREWPYKNVKPKIICEKYIKDNASDELMDYKLMCFNGEVKCTFVCSNRKSSKGLNIDIFDRDWNLMPFQRPLHPNSGTKVNPPKNYKKMIEFAEKLSKDIPFLRVDFYEVNGHVYFGELTFYPGSGFERFMPESYDELLGRWIKLPEKQA